MSVFVITKEKLEELLGQFEFVQTDIKTKTHTIWKNKKGDILPVLHTEIAYPHEYLEELLGVYGMKATWQGEIIETRRYKCEPSNDD